MTGTYRPLAEVEVAGETREPAAEEVTAIHPLAEPTVERVPLAVDVDFEFVFTIVDGKGTVESR